MIKKKTVKDASKKLPVKSRKHFLRAWEATGYMDLYNGDLEVYLQFIAQKLEKDNKGRKLVVEAINNLAKITKRIM